VQQPIKNLTLHDSLVRIAVLVGVSYETDVATLRAAFQEVAGRHEGADPAYPPKVILMDLASSSLVYEVSVWIHDPWDHRLHRSRLREAILAACRAKKIVIAFPQIDVHMPRAA